MIPIEDFLLAAEAVLGIDAERLARTARIELAESALAAPFASFEGHEFYVHPIQKAAVLASRIMRNHALPDGNKRVALVMMRNYLSDQGFRLEASATEIDRVFRAVAAREMPEDRFELWAFSRAQQM